MTILIAILMIGLLVFAHELGHFLTAKASGILVQEFALGMGPVIFSRQLGETRYSIRALPIGGFARMAGEEFNEEDQRVPEHRRFDKKPTYTRGIVLAAGSLMNFFLAMLIFILVFVFMGVPSAAPVIGDVSPGNPAALAGIQPGDRVAVINGEPVQSWQDIQRLVGQRANQSLQLEVIRNGDRLSFSITPQPDQTGKGLIGIAPSVEKFSILASIRMGWEETIWFTRQIISLVGSMITGRIPAEGAGPIGMIVMVGQVARTGLANLMTFAAIISIQLGLFNLLPIPALDGGKLLFIAVEVLRGRPIDPEKESFVHFVGFVLLMAFLVLVTYRDIQRLNLF